MKQETFSSGLLDLTQPTTGRLLIPAKPGFFPVMVSRNWVIRSTTGGQTTPATVRAGSDPGRVNFIASTTTTPANLDVNGASPPSLGAGPGFGALTAKRYPNEPILLDVVSPAAGGDGFALFAELVVNINWVAG